MDIYVECGSKKVFAGAIDWAGWCRSGRNEQAATATLLEYARRYAAVVAGSGLPFTSPASLDQLVTKEKVAGNATTDFGAPDAALVIDDAALDADELQRLQILLTACWDALDAAVATAGSRELRKGPRGGGRDTVSIFSHVLDAEQSYLRRLGQNAPRAVAHGDQDQLTQFRRLQLEALAAAAAGELPSRGPRGGHRWLPRRWVRRVAWHALDHVWEIEDRIP